MVQLFPATGSLEFVVTDIVGPFSKSTQGNQFVHVITDQYSKLTLVISTIKTTATQNANIFFDHWPVCYAIPT